MGYIFASLITLRIRFEMLSTGVRPGSRGRFFGPLVECPGVLLEGGVCKVSAVPELGRCCAMLRSICMRGREYDTDGAVDVLLRVSWLPPLCKVKGSSQTKRVPHLQKVRDAGGLARAY